MNKAISRVTTAAIVLCLAGCAEFYPNGPFVPYSMGSADPYLRSDIDELLRFGADLANRSASSRAETCRQLLKREQDAPSVGVQLHLMMGRVLSESCGDIPKLLASLDAIPPARLADHRVRSLVVFHVATLKRLGASGKKLAVNERKQKATRPAADAKSDDARILREKLDAIRAIEKNLDAAEDAD